LLLLIAVILVFLRFILQKLSTEFHLNETVISRVLHVCGSWCPSRIEDCRFRCFKTGHRGQYSCI